MASMTITRRSQATGQCHTRTIAISNLHLLRWGQGEPMETVAPQLTPDERRFLATGVSPEETIP